MMRRAQGLVRVLVIGAAVCAAGAAAVVYFLINRPALTVTRVVEGPVVQAFYATGTVQPKREYPVNTSVAGILRDVKVDKGSVVHKGDLLGVVVDPQMQFAVDKAKADLEVKKEFADEKRSPVMQEFDAKIEAMGQILAVAKHDEERFHMLAEKNAASWKDRDLSFEHMQTLWSELEAYKKQRAAKLRELQADLETAESAYRTALANLDLQNLRSPIDGVVLDRPVPEGTRLELNGHVMRIADVSVPKLVMRAQVDEENVKDVKEGGTVRMALYSFPSRTFEGKVTDIYPQADPSRRTFEVDVQFTTPPDLKAGMTGELAFVVREKPRAMVVPSQALQSQVIWTVKTGRLTKTAAKVGITSIERVEVTSGLQPSDIVVISPVAGLRDGQAVRIEQTMDPVIAADLNKPKEVEVFKAFH